MGCISCDSIPVPEDPTAVSFPDAMDKSFFVYPNPTTGEFVVCSSEFGIKEITVYNLPGEKVCTATTNDKLKTINANLPKGIYFVKARTQNFVYVRKLIVE
jgi:hypothetical protein